ncbi:hypothetical protein DSM03_1011093 [Leeuwenhoekiella aestuarii]|uniref:Uncharacterized protein n=1 Tax=Leeuwenhoekiella aestuarii TaxID=2249426 RepID=A0A4Q0NZK6_9FLAO|nr:hypothetical protein DSM04_101604 [Leeuwenhoekiella aestuarii]RXG19715.1 hypothetical protein DSM03_1011093 [Leeuwenhoekiella aestuarii]
MADALKTNFQFRGKPRGIKPFGGANKKGNFIRFVLFFSWSMLKAQYRLKLFKIKLWKLKKENLKIA